MRQNLPQLPEVGRPHGVLRPRALLSYIYHIRQRRLRNQTFRQAFHILTESVDIIAQLVERLNLLRVRPLLEGIAHIGVEE